MEGGVKKNLPEEYDTSEDRDYNYHESCKDRYSRYFSPELKRLFQEHGKSIPFMMEILDEVCVNRTCSHNIFWDGIVWGDTHRGEGGNNPHPTPSDCDWTIKCRNCMCLLEIGDGASNLEIGRAFGVDRRAVYRFEQKALSKIRKLMGGDELAKNAVNN